MTLCRPCQAATGRGGGAAPARAGAPTRAGGPQAIALGTIPRKRSKSRIVFRWIGIVLFITVMLSLKALSVGVAIGLVSLGEPPKDKAELAKEAVSGYEIEYTSVREEYPEIEEEEETAGVGEADQYGRLRTRDSRTEPEPAKTWEVELVKEETSSTLEELIIYYDLKAQQYDYARSQLLDTSDNLFADDEEEPAYLLDWRAEPEKGWKNRGNYIVRCEFNGEPYTFHLTTDRTDRKNPKPVVTGLDANGKALLALKGKEIKWKPPEREANPHDPRYINPSSNPPAGD